MMAASFTNREKITIKQVEVNMADKIKSFWKVLLMKIVKIVKTLKVFLC